MATLKLQLLPVIAVALWTTWVLAQDQEWHFNSAQCRYALGMEDGSIPDSAITASSAWSDSTEAKHGRLSTGEGDGAWCPMGAVYPSGSEYLQVDLGALHFLSLVGTQGRHADGHGREFARSYRLRYSRDGRQWFTWKDRWGQEVISGNENTYDVVLKDLGPPVVARMVRFYPLADRVMSVCLRVELYGCLWNDGLKAYTAPVGHVMHLSGAPVYLNDSTYDGSIEAGVQFGGLGQLCDGVLGGDDFTESKELRVWPGYDYLGWSREALGQGSVDIEFHFEKTRTFHTMQVHSNNRHTQGVRVFNKVECVFKPTLLQPWSSPPLTLPVPLADLKDPSSRPISLPLGGRPAQILRCQFFFTDPWLLISEISFYSEPYVGNFSETASVVPVPPPASPSSTPSPAAAVPTSPRPSLTPEASNRTSEPTDPPTTVTQPVTNSTVNEALAGVEFAAMTPRPGVPVAKDDSSNTAILIGCLVGIILLLLAVIAVILWRQYWKKILGKAQGSLSSDELRVHLSVPADNVVINNTHSYSSRYQRIHTFPDEREREGEGEYQEPSALLRPRDDCDSTALLLNNPAYHLLLSEARYVPSWLTNAPRSQEKPQNVPQACGVDMDMEKFPSTQDEPPPYPGAPPYPHGPSSSPPPPLLPPLGPASVPHYAEADIVCLQGVSGNNTYAVPALSSSPPDCPPLPELPRHCLLFKEKLGEGQFGEVHLCEIENPQDLPNLEFPFNVRKGRPLLVAVKILRPDASKNARNDFLKEVKILSRLKDPNIIRLLGVCVSSDPLCMVTEYMECGDLNQHLSHRVLLDKSGPSHNTPTISYPALISMASQIASGMKFLSSLNFVHRDLATRNCLVGGERGEPDDGSGERQIKIADFGMSRNLYAGDYYRIQGRAVLPIRWMAWECILMGKFTTASDVWAFGVTLWEMLNMCQEQPYCNLTDEQVIDNAGEFFRDHGRQVYLSRPAVCPQGLYELMLSCWNRDCKLRPSFAHIHSFLTEDAMNMV
ncbi:epithelial discoidin domain-containing receptor 1 isoform X1 [Alosa sapidissima]|uniref:epithelial discoidin domain-containing receptor 1 isoform X1 n=1 Tax=Alosa sapidissima TaxID=34773 RepID=UPI001C093141|nr:epithelial discoidin domain-containing receptor 1 isoform X1 [Alosa sapidissima]XP_041964472.1 epithelial discoidin domain-containing receptor 1 isoform X1 [Alosa sapidissima]XP_041964473.1 epithelial discoidin domain-containing receptor 1 isoform X1 [Alosa sapidissima]XP_041964474.1 epithelial discoidin domain-containing receptor 1 isoform X1 [Alosa sapidissima]XP_041964475.1 epithelial discoidin domain-containing receptor 1 isoform X1 [Alosa sapidissima]